MWSWPGNSSFFAGRTFVLVDPLEVAKRVRIPLGCEFSRNRLTLVGIPAGFVAVKNREYLKIFWSSCSLFRRDDIIEVSDGDFYSVHHHFVGPNNQVSEAACKAARPKGDVELPVRADQVPEVSPHQRFTVVVERETARHGVGANQSPQLFEGSRQAIEIVGGRVRSEVDISRCGNWGLLCDGGERADHYEMHTVTVEHIDDRGCIERWLASRFHSLVTGWACRH